MNTQTKTLLSEIVLLVLQLMYLLLSVALALGAQYLVGLLVGDRWFFPERYIFNIVAFVGVLWIMLTRRWKVIWIPALISAGVSLILYIIGLALVILAMSSF